MTSTNYRMWKSIPDISRCSSCKRLHGKVYHRRDQIRPNIPLHPMCRCKITWLNSLTAGTATSLGINGEDWWLKNYGRLPPYYVSWNEAITNGWNPEMGNFHEVYPGNMIKRGIYENKNGHLPSARGRIWYEADINYSGGFRGDARIVYSNDGLIFVTYDHYATFIEIV